MRGGAKKRPVPMPNDGSPLSKLAKCKGGRGSSITVPLALNEFLNDVVEISSLRDGEHFDSIRSSVDAV